MAGQHDDRRLEAVLAQDAHGLASVDVGKADVHDDEIDLAGLGGLHALGAGLDRDASNSSCSASCSTSASRSSASSSTIRILRVFAIDAGLVKAPRGAIMRSRPFGGKRASGSQVLAFTTLPRRPGTGNRKQFSAMRQFCSFPVGSSGNLVNSAAPQQVASHAPIVAEGGADKGTRRVAVRGWLVAGSSRGPVALGRSGIHADKREGDGATPRGSFRPLRLWWRADRGPRPAHVAARRAGSADATPGARTGRPAIQSAVPTPGAWPATGSGATTTSTI